MDPALIGLIGVLAGTVLGGALSYFNTVSSDKRAAVVARESREEMLDWERARVAVERELDRTRRFADEKLELFSAYLAALEERSARVQIARLQQDPQGSGAEALRESDLQFHTAMYGLNGRMTLLAGDVQLQATKTWAALARWEEKVLLLNGTVEAEIVEEEQSASDVARSDFDVEVAQLQAAMRLSLGVADVQTYEVTHADR